MSVRYIDAHCHVQFDQYKEDRAQVVGEMEKQGIAGVVVGCDLESSKKAIAFAEQHEQLFASVGLHPNSEPDEWYEIETYRALAAHPKVVAIGECGLDYFRPKQVTAEVKKKQGYILHDQIRLAGELDKPLIIHSRPSKGTQDAYQDLIVILTKAKETYPNLRGDIHFFVGGIEEAKALTTLGFTVSFTAVVTFARDYDAAIASVPLESILVETDAPYVAPVSRRGQRNDPLAIPEVVEKLAEIRGEDPELVRTVVLANTKRLFRLPEAL